jgi:hypothetical protein
MTNAMGRPKREDRATVAETTLTLRLTLAEKDGLERVVAHREAELRQAHGMPGLNLSMAGFIRSLIAREMTAFEATQPAPVAVVAAPPPAPKHDPEADYAAVLATVRSKLTPKMGSLVMVPDIARACATSGITLDRVHAALMLANQRKETELRPDSSMSTKLSTEDAALCPKGFDDVALSVLRVIDADVSTPAPTPSAQIDPDALRRRIKKANKAGHSYASIADAAGINRGTFSGFTGGRPLGADKVAELDAALRRLGH